jgi:hypothetical protein
VNKELILAWSPAAIRAAEWIRQHTSKPLWESIDTEFEEHFQCKLIQQSNGIGLCPESVLYLEFEPEQATLFLLRWS